ncbi:exodeoxyribonuclease VII large subunit [Rarobacter faecitabidus]|uniref:Exodeoxyribonuclease 7 large subunit n=1 Tax=Rarobacter faecitabidus TaxID=13243 RepID=A0A542ZUF7_RARFA|nr:exodeoxyribonuclease VII large subunit [Rarobacter faecitabidus]TQL63977.1 exodeoxyribonuclease VII large subunit [Rarobacter faecitabidus]
MDLPELARDTTADHPWPVRLLSAKIEDYIARMSMVWVEGQVVQLSRRPGSGMAFLTLRDTEINESLSVSVYTRVLEAGPPIKEGDQVVVRAKATFWRTRGSLQLQADQIRPVGVGDLLARIENLKRTLAGEGLFDADRKRPLPFLPRVVGLVCGRESKAEHDVRVNAAARWPAVVFETRQVAVQGAQAVGQVSAAIEELDALELVDVIVVARGGGSVEDLLPFSNEALVRVAAHCRTPLVSAIGHETDTPLLDLVADFRASTPTDAAKRIVPDLREEMGGVARARARLGELVHRRLDREENGLAALRTRPALARPETVIEAHEERLAAATGRLRAHLENRLIRAERDLTALKTGVRALSPAHTLERGYAIVQGPSGEIVRDSAQITRGDEVLARLAAGTLTATVTATNQYPPSTSG